MKEFVFVQFIFTSAEYATGMKELSLLGEDFQITATNANFIDIGSQVVLIEGKINSMTASTVRLGNKFLADKMRISIISENLKNKYRS